MELIVNLNQIKEICFKQKSVADYFEWKEEFSFTNLLYSILGMKKKVKKNEYIATFFGSFVSNTAEEFNSTNKTFHAEPNSRLIFEKAHVDLVDCNDRVTETRYFDTNLEAKECFNKLLQYAKEKNLPFINFYAEKL